MPRITFDKVTKRFGVLEVLKPLDLKLDDGEFTVLVGPSGCGKSTTLRILAGLETLSSGEIYFDERPITRLEPKQRDVAMVFQDYALYPHMNIARNMSFALRLARTPKAEIEQRVKRVAKMLNIDHLLLRKPSELSGGQRQRVAMGRALVRDVSTILFDEPLSNLDARLRGQMRAELALMRDQLDKNMVYVTHDQVEAMTLGDRIVVMNDGAIQQQGTPEELFTRPRNRFVAGFIGSPSMNFLDARLAEQRGALWAEGAGFRLPLSRELAARANTTRSKDVTVGIRPSSIRLAGQSEEAFDLKVEVVEYQGSQTTLITSFESGERLTVEIPSHSRLTTGTAARFSAAEGDIHLFDRESGLAI